MIVKEMRNSWSEDKMFRGTKNFVPPKQRTIFVVVIFWDAQQYWWQGNFGSILRWSGYVARMGQRRGVYRVLVGKPDGKRPLRRPRRKWEDNIKMDLQEVGCWGMDWIDLAQDRDMWQALVNVVMDHLVP